MRQCERERVVASVLGRQRPRADTQGVVGEQLAHGLADGARRGLTGAQVQPGTAVGHAGCDLGLVFGRTGNDQRWTPRRSAVCTPPKPPLVTITRVLGNSAACGMNAAMRALLGELAERELRDRAAPRGGDHQYVFAREAEQGRRE